MFEQSTPLYQSSDIIFPDYPVVFASCDSRYFIEHGPAFIASANAIGKNVHIHLYDATAEASSLFVNIQSFQNLKIKLTVSGSSPVQEFASHDEYRTYCACMRFIVLPELLVSAKNVLTLDIDCLLMKDFDFPQKSVAYFPREPIPGTVGWENQGTRVAAGAVYFNEDAINLTKKIKDRILQGPLKWFLDQIALSEVLDNVDAHHFDSEFMDWEFKEGTTIWTGKGPRKYDNPVYISKKKEFNDMFTFPEEWKWLK